MFKMIQKATLTSKLCLGAIVFCAGLCGCGVMPGGCQDTTAPTVIFTSPANLEVGVGTNEKVAATFSTGMDVSSLTATFTVEGANTIHMPGVIEYDVATNIATFYPTGGLSADSTYTAIITTDAQNMAGVGLENNFSWSFTTGALAASASSRPRVIDTGPEDGEFDVMLDIQLTATFDQAMDPSTINESQFTLTGPGDASIVGVVTYHPDGKSAAFTPASDLAPITEYTATLSASITNLAGRGLKDDYSWHFTTGLAITGPGPDSTAPTVILTLPASAATNVALNSVALATFSEAMDPSTIGDAQFTLVDPLEVPVAGAVTYDALNNTATFTPDLDLEPNTEYTATITTAVEDLAGNGLASDFTWSFTTGVSLDTTAPQVIFVSPADGLTGVALNTVALATFSEAMDPSTIGDAQFTLVDPLAIPVAGAVTYDALNNTATFTPDLDLDPNTEYTATITTAVEDLAGNGLASDFTWSFTTGAAPDTTAPQVIFISPADGLTGVALNTVALATFNEAMDPSTIGDAQFTLVDPLAIPVAGAVTYDALNNTATFTPDLDLDPNTEYTATITTAVEDLAGNGLASDFTWSFTTGAAPDTTAPQVIFISPADGLTGVALNRVTLATFSEAMNPATIGDAQFTLVDPLAVPVAGVVTYDAFENTATFTPDLDLEPNTEYTATITTAVEDLAGNGLASDFTWSYTTGTTLAQEPVELGLLSTFAAVAGAGLTNSNSGGQTTINGDVGLSPTATCLGDGFPCSALNPLINGTLYANDPEGVAAEAKVALTLAYDEAAARPPGTTVNDLSGMILPPGVYSSGSTMSIAVGGVLTLDAQGDPNAVWIFQVGSSLTVNNNAQVLLINGAKAGNVFWAIFASSTMGTNVVFKGNVLAGESNSLGTGTVVEGRMLCRTGQITLLSNTVTVPAS